MFELAIAVILVLVSSALASGTEAALFNVAYGRVLAAVEQERFGADSLLHIKDHPERPITAIVIVNNIANIVGSIAVGAIAASVLSANWLGVFSGVLTFLVIVYSEIIPKSLGERYAEPISLIAAKPVMWLTRVFVPLILFIEILTRPFVGIRTMTAPGEEEIKALTQMGGDAGNIEQDENELIQRVFRLNDVSAREIMTPISRADTLRVGQTISDLRDYLGTVTHSRLPVHGENIDEIVGIVHLRELLLGLADDNDDPVETLAVRATFVPSTLQADDLIVHFRATKQHLAMVVNDRGTVLGVVTLEDVLEQLVGDIADETDIEELPVVETVDDHTVIADAGAMGVRINDHLNTSLPDQRLGELVIAAAGRIPEVGDEVELADNLIAVVIAGTPRRVEKLRLVLSSAHETD